MVLPTYTEPYMEVCSSTSQHWLSIFSVPGSVPGAGYTKVKKKNLLSPQETWHLVEWTECELINQVKHSRSVIV